MKQRIPGAGWRRVAARWKSGCLSARAAQIFRPQRAPVPFNPNADSMPTLERRVRPGAVYLAGAPLLIAHRGGARLAPENTLTAFDQAVHWWRCDVLELDVQPTRDGEAVVLHDERVDRTTDGVGAVADLRLREVAQLDAGHRFSPDVGQSFPYRDRGVRIPTLAEVLARFPAQRVNVEIKDGRAAARVREVIAAAGAEHRVLLAAGKREDRRAAGDYPGATSASEGEIRAFYLAHRLRLSRLLPHPVDALQLPHRHKGREVATADLVRDAHRANLAVHVWTVDEMDEMRRLLSYGVDGIVTDRPDRLARALHQHCGRAPPPGPPEHGKPGFLERLLLA